MAQMSGAARKRATFHDLAALGDVSAEVIHGVIVYKADPSAEHGDAQLALGALLRQHFHRKGGPAGPGGWWLLTDVDVAFAEHEVYRPDIAGWRRDRVLERPTGRPIAVRPDFICEILSESNAATDQVDKFRAYAASSMPFYWIADPGRKILTVYRLEGDGYAVALHAKPGEVVNAPPFEAFALSVGLLFGDDPD